MKKIASKNKGIKLIRKSNDLVEARYKFDIWETRVFTKLLTIIRPEDIDFQPFRIYLRDVIDDFKLHKDKASYHLLREATDNLLKKVFYVPYEVEGAVRERKYPIIIMTDTLKEAKDDKTRAKNEYVEVCIHPEMKPLLLQLKEKFTSYDIENITSLKSNYTLRIYEHLKQYERIGRRQLEIDYLKRIFEITTEYPLFANFYQKIIEPAFEDINRFTDITITKIGKVKRGRRVEALLFEFYKKTEKHAIAQALPAPDETMSVVADSSKTEDTLYLRFQEKVVMAFGVSPTVFMNELKTKTEAQILKAIRVTEDGQKNGSLKNPAGFFLQALRQNFTSETEEKRVKTAKLHEKQTLLLTIKKQIDTLKDEQMEEIYNRIRELTSTNPKITEQAVLHIKSSPLKNKFIQNLEETSKKPLNMQDFRDNKLLRQMVIETIFEQNQVEFKDITEGYQTQISKLQNELIKLS
jgi:plasmid replication initiation protein